MLNKAENAFKEYAKSNGWVASKQGWPDFILFDKKDKPIGVVEVKLKKSHRDFIEGRPSLATTKRLKHQKAVRDFLISHGIQVRIWTPTDYFG